MKMNFFMKTTYRLFYVITLLLAFLVVGCSEDDDPKNDQDTEQPGDGPGGEEEEEMYFPPIGSDDWETTSPEELGWNEANFNDAIQYAKDNRSANLLIIHRGKIVSENYWRNTTADSLHDLNSVAKSFMAIVLGVLQQQGKLSIDDKVSDYLAPGWSTSPKEADITIRHLMTMTSGLNDELGYVGNPGEMWRYSHEAYKVLYDVISAATGESYRKLFDDILFSKIGMTKFTWSGKNIATTSRPLARFGLMVLNRGVWDGQRVIEDDDYFKNMYKSSQTFNPAYGHLWWLNDTDNWFNTDTKTMMSGSIAATMPSDGILAKGKHDQRVYIVPSLDLVVVRQGEYTGLPESGDGSFDVELWRRLMNAIEHGALNND
jgi:CubicO group peptidase (beta-lactamase class C family)